jgi:RNA polymerase sigma-70 factor (ECF subfamily)
MSAVGLDTVSQAWVDCLRSPGDDDCVARLRELLLRAARREVGRRAGLLRVRGLELDDLAHQAADDALVAILDKVDGFRGDSRFTTWAYKFVMFEVSTKIGRHFSRAEVASMDEVDWDRVADRLAAEPERRAEALELLDALRLAVENDLTDRQRLVFVAVALNEVPMDALVDDLGSNRNAVYKTLHDARRKLRASLAAAGHTIPVGRS